MRKIIIASHHKLAYGMKETLNFITSFPHIYDISAYVEHDDIQSQIDQVMAVIEAEDEVLIFTDILGGSVTQNFFPYCSDRIHVICGMNLPLLITFALSPDTPFTKDGISGMISQAREGIIYVNDYLAEVSEEDE